MYYFIVNESGGSGRARKTWIEVKTILKARDVSYKAFRTEYEGHASLLAEKIAALADDDIRLIVVGGDGTINEVINGIGDYSKIKLGIIPTGSGNDFARGFNISKNVESAVDRALSSEDGKAVDLGRVILDDGTERYYGISAGVGLDAIVCKKALDSKQKVFLNRFGLGRLTYLLLTVETVFSMEKTNARIETENGISKLSDIIFLAAMNMKAEGGGVPMTPDASYDDGYLSICSAYDISRPKAFTYLPFLACGKHYGFKNVLKNDVSYVDITLEKPVTVHADGEYLGEHSHIRMECIKRVLKIL